MTVVANLYYLPPIGYFKNLSKAETIILEGAEHYQKRTARNRCWTPGANGVVMMSIPLAKGKNEAQNIKDVKISNATDWQSNHWKSILTNYGSSPFLAHYRDYFEPVYQETFTHLWDFNIKLFDIVCDILQISPSIEISLTYNESYSDGYIDQRDNVDARALPINSEVYSQVFTYKHGFSANMSILDLIMCLGPEAGSYLKRL